MTDLTHTFELHRSLLFGIAYRMTGSAMDAEDLVQEAYLRWSGVSLDTVRSPRDYLVTTVTRLALDYLGSARVRREAYIGPWLPEPVIASHMSEPMESRVELAESLQTAFLVVLETLAPPERAALLLHDVFGYGYSDLATILGKSEDSCRQVVHRARTRVREGQPRFESSLQQLEAVTHHFIAACANGTVDALLQILAPDVIYIGDGGGKVENARRPVAGAMNVARLLIGLLTRKAPPDVRWSIESVNGQLGVVAWTAGKPYGVLTLAVAQGRVQAIYLVSNPEKLLQFTAPTQIQIGAIRASGNRTC